MVAVLWKELGAKLSEGLFSPSVEAQAKDEWLWAGRTTGVLGRMIGMLRVRGLVVLLLVMTRLFRSVMSLGFVVVFFWHDLRGRELRWIPFEKSEALRIEIPKRTSAAMT